MREPTAVQRLRARVLVAAMAATAAIGVVARWPAGGTAPPHCPAPAHAEGVLVCDGAGAPARARAWLAGKKLDVNEATATDLEAIPGVGASLAAAIVSTRDGHGRFSTLASLDDVPGVGPKTLEKLGRYVEVR